MARMAAVQVEVVSAVTGMEAVPGVVETGKVEMVEEERGEEDAEAATRDMVLLVQVANSGAASVLAVYEEACLEREEQEAVEDRTAMEMSGAALVAKVPVVAWTAETGIEEEEHRSTR